MRLIDGDAFSDWLKEYGQEYIHGKKKISLMYIWKHVQDMPTIEPERKGKWLMDGTHHGEPMYRCSECKVAEAVPTATSFISGITYPQWHYCPNCGAMML